MRLHHLQGCMSHYPLLTLTPFIWTESRYDDDSHSHAEPRLNLRIAWNTGGSSGLDVPNSMFLRGHE